MKALIFGATGTVGSEIVKRLAAEQIAVHALSRNGERRADSGTTKWFSYDIADGGGTEPMWEGVDRVFLLSPPGYDDQYAIMAPVIDKAKAVGVKKFVLMTAWGVEHAIGSPFQRAEVHLKESGLNYTILRPNWFMQNHFSFWGEGIRRNGVLSVPGGDALTSFIDARDIAAVAAAVLQNEERQELSLSGPEALSHEDTVNILTQVLGRSVLYESADETPFAKQLLAAGLPEGYVNLLLTLFSLLREGLNAPINHNVKAITGREPISFKQFVSDNRAAFSV